MVSNPTLGLRVELRYAAARRRCHGDLHLQRGVVVVRGRGKPRNHGVRHDDGRRLVVPCGNLFTIKEDAC